MLLGHFKSVNEEFLFIEMIFFIINTGNCIFKSTIGINKICIPVNQ